MRCLHHGIQQFKERIFATREKLIGLLAKTTQARKIRLGGWSRHNSHSPTGGADASPAATFQGSKSKRWLSKVEVLNNPLNLIDPTGTIDCRADGTCIGSYNGEENGNLRWSDRSNLWVTQSEYRIGKAIDDVQRLQKYDQGVVSQEHTQAGLLPLLAPAGGIGGGLPPRMGPRISPRGNTLLIAVALAPIVLNAIENAIDNSLNHPPIPVGTILPISPPPLTMPAPLDPNIFAKGGQKNIRNEWNEKAVNEVGNDVAAQIKWLQEAYKNAQDAATKQKIKTAQKAIDGRKNSGGGGR